MRFAISYKPYALCSILPICFLLASCQSAEDRPPLGATTVVFTHGKLTAAPDVLQSLFTEFERTHPGVTVREEVLPSSSDQQHQFYAMNLEGRSVAFDVLAMDTIWVQEFARAGWVQPLDHLLPPTEREAFFSSAIQAALFDHRLHAVPWYVDTGVLFYRQDLLERYGFRAPRTWPELVQITRVILDQEDDPTLKGFVWPGKQSEGLVCVSLEFIWGHGGTLANTPGTEAETALAFMRDLIVQGMAPDLVATADEEATRHVFGAGRAIFMRNWPYAWSLLQQTGSTVQNKIGMAPLPSFPGHVSASVLGGWMLGIPRGAAHPEVAGELIRFLTTPHAQAALARAVGYKPSRHVLYDDASLLHDQPWLRDLYPLLLAARPRPASPYYLLWSQIWQPELSAVLVGVKSPRSALAAARGRIAKMAPGDQPLRKESLNRIQIQHARTTQPAPTF